MRTLLRAAFLAPLALFAACSSSDDQADGQGSVAFNIWGEDFIEQQIPADKVEDGWSIKYSKFLVSVGGITVADAGGQVAAQMTGSKLFDMTKPGVKPVVRFDGLPAKSWDAVSFEITPVTAETELAVAAEADKQLMLAGGYSVYIDATATKGAVTKKYTWGFTTATAYRQCQADVGGKETLGVVVTNGGTDEPQITIHGDHLYYDDLQDPASKVRFDNIAAADADNDGVITMAELSAVELAKIPAAQGPYGTGSAAGINDLGAFHTALSRTVGHWRGEGECFSSLK